MSAGGIPWNDQPFGLLHALGTAFLDGCVFLACPKHSGYRVRILGVGTDAPGHQLIYPLASPDEQNCILFISCWLQFQVSEVSLARPYSTSVLQVSMAMVQEVAVVVENKNTSIVRDEQRCHQVSVHVPGDGSEHRMSSCLGVPLVLLASARSRLAPEMCFVIASTTQKVRKNVDNHMGKCTHLLGINYCIVLKLIP